MPLSERLISRLRRTFPTQAFEIAFSPNLVVSIPARHPSVGGVEIYDDGDEITLYLGKFTHTHLDVDDEAPEKAVDAVIELLSELFSDNLVLWGTHWIAGGFYRRRRATGLAWLLSRIGRRYVWSGPL